MKRTISIFTSLLCFALVTVRAQEKETRFRPGEWEVSPFATYVDRTGNKWGAGIEGTKFLNNNFGLGVSTFWTEGGGTFFDNIAGEGYFRIPLFQSVSPYAVGSLGYEFEASRAWFETLGAGIDFRAFKRFAAFSDIQYRWVNETNIRNGVFLRLGVRFAF